MDEYLFEITLTNLVFIGILPFIFFRRDGSFNARWWLTGAPFFVSAATLIAAFMGRIALWPEPQYPGVLVLAALLPLVSTGMICWTLGSHRVPLALWHQDNDAPASIVTWGPYKYVRHPFYTSFMISQTGAFLVAPHWGTALGLAHALIALGLTARREERRLLASSFGGEYRKYMASTGRFVPGIGRLAV